MQRRAEAARGGLRRRPDRGLTPTRDGSPRTAPPGCCVPNRSPPAAVSRGQPQRRERHAQHPRPRGHRGRRPRAHGMRRQRQRRLARQHRPGAGAEATVTSKDVDGVGRVLVDPTGQALYAADQETGGNVLCVDACTSIWRPLAAGAAMPSGTDGVGTLGVVTRPDGSTQVTVAGQPLYTFTQEGPGQVTGNGFADTFGDQSSSGTPSSRAARAPATRARARLAATTTDARRDPGPRRGTLYGPLHGRRQRPAPRARAARAGPARGPRDEARPARLVRRAARALRRARGAAARARALPRRQRPRAHPPGARGRRARLQEGPRPRADARRARRGAPDQRGRAAPSTRPSRGAGLRAAARCRLPRRDAGAHGGDVGGLARRAGARRQRGDDPPDAAHRRPHAVRVGPRPGRGRPRGRQPDRTARALRVARHPPAGSAPAAHTDAAHPQLPRRASLDPPHRGPPRRRAHRCRHRRRRPALRPARRPRRGRARHR